MEIIDFSEENKYCGGRGGQTDLQSCRGKSELCWGRGGEAFLRREEQGGGVAAVWAHLSGKPFPAQQRGDGVRNIGNIRI